LCNKSGNLGNPANPIKTPSIRIPLGRYNTRGILLVYINYDSLTQEDRMATAKKKSVSKAKKKKSVKKASPAKQKELKSGSGYECRVCGLAVTVDEVCGCVDYCDIICCGEQMKPAK
jgi:hypothetical protein